MDLCAAPEFDLYSIGYTERLKKPLIKVQKYKKMCFSPQNFEKFHVGQTICVASSMFFGVRNLSKPLWYPFYAVYPKTKRFRTFGDFLSEWILQNIRVKSALETIQYEINIAHELGNFWIGNRLLNSSVGGTVGWYPPTILNNCFRFPLQIPQLWTPPCIWVMQMSHA